MKSFLKNYGIVIISMISAIVAIGIVNYVLGLVFGVDSLMAEIGTALLVLPIGIVTIVTVTNYLKKKDEGNSAE